MLFLQNKTLKCPLYYGDLPMDKREDPTAHRKATYQPS